MVNQLKNQEDNAVHVKMFGKFSITYKENSLLGKKSQRDPVCLFNADITASPDRRCSQGRVRRDDLWGPGYQEHPPCHAECDL